MGKDFFFAVAIVWAFGLLGIALDANNERDKAQQARIEALEAQRIELCNQPAVICITSTPKGDYR